MASAGADSATRSAWWREWEVLALIAIVLIVYFSRLTAVPLRGEETRRAMVAREILWTGDWIVPRQQDEPFLSRPPLGSYPIAWLAMLSGDCSPLATRLPTALATLLTTLLIYAYARLHLSRLGALVSGLSYATMGQVLQLGQLAETEAAFTLLVAGSLLLWHWGYVKRWHGFWTWGIAYLCVGLGALAKGPQAPVYFAGTVGLFLLYHRDWRTLLSRWHFAGIGIFTIVLGAWQIPFYMRLGWPAVKDVWGGDVGLRFVDTSWATIIAHLATFPVEVWICLLPSSLLMLAYLRPSFWKQIQSDWPWVSFLVFAILVTFPTCWIVPGAKARYYMPLYPCFAPLAGLVMDELLREPTKAWLSQLWRNYLRVMLGASVAGAIAVVVFAAWPNLPSPYLRQTPHFAVAYVTLCVATGYLLLKFSRQRDEGSLRKASLVSATFIGLTYTGLLLNVTQAGSEQIAEQVRGVKEQLPPGEQLVSFNLLETAFTYHYNAPVPLLPWPKTVSDVPPEVNYFSVCAEGGTRPDLPFAWREVAVISSDRWKRSEPKHVTIIGQRLKNDVAHGERTLLIR